MVELYLHSRKCLHDRMLSQISTMTQLHLYFTLYDYDLCWQQMLVTLLKYFISCSYGTQALRRMNTYVSELQTAQPHYPTVSPADSTAF